MKPWIVRVTAVTGILSAQLLPSRSEAVDRPNIIVFLTDDQDKDSLGAYGGKTWTPNLDQMAAEGMIFHNAFVASTVCTPSRYAFLTGRYASRSYSEAFQRACPAGMQAFPAFNVSLEEDNMNMGAILHAAGYRTGFVGKYHVSGEENVRNQEAYKRYGMTFIPRDAQDTPEIAKAFRKNELMTRKLIQSRGFDWAKHVYMGNLDKPYEQHNLEWTIEAALEFIEESKDGPFYLQFCTTLIHGPEKSWSRSMNYPLISGEGPLSAPIEPEGMLSRKEILAELQRRGLDPDAGYAGYSWVDAGVGAIFAKLKKLGIDENTLVIFTADHGIGMKGALYDVNGACVPFIMRWPHGIKAGSQCSELVQSIDIAATAFDLAGVNLPKEYRMDGRSMRPLFDGKPPASWRDHLYIELGFGRAIRTKDWKYISVRYPAEQVAAIRDAPNPRLPILLAPLNRSGIGVRGAKNPNFYYEDELFNVSQDPLEMKNMAGDPEYGPQLKKMQQQLTDDLKSIGRPYGELIPGGNATAPGQVDEQLKRVRTMKVHTDR